MTLFERVFGGNDAVYGLTEAAIDNAIAQYGEGQAVSFPDTAYSLPCYYAVTGSKVGTLGELKQALGVVKTLMTRNPRLNDAFMSGVATALCAEFIEVLKYLNGAAPYELPCYGHLSDAVIRNLGVPLVTGDIPGVAVILGSAPSADEAVALVKSYQSQGILITLVGGVIDQLEEKGYKTGDNVRVIPLGKDVTAVIHVVSVALRAALIFGNITPGDAGASVGASVGCSVGSVTAVSVGVTVGAVISRRQAVSATSKSSTDSRQSRCFLRIRLLVEPHGDRRKFRAGRRRLRADGAVLCITEDQAAQRLCHSLHGGRGLIRPKKSMQDVDRHPAF